MGLTWDWRQRVNIKNAYRKIKTFLSFRMGNKMQRQKTNCLNGEQIGWILKWLNLTDFCKKNIASKDLSSEKQESTPFDVSNASGFKITTLKATAQAPNSRCWTTSHI